MLPEPGEEEGWGGVLLIQGTNFYLFLQLSVWPLIVPSSCQCPTSRGFSVWRLKQHPVSRGIWKGVPGKCGNRLQGSWGLATSWSNCQSSSFSTCAHSFWASPWSFGENRLAELIIPSASLFQLSSICWHFFSTGDSAAPYEFNCFKFLTVIIERFQEEQT